MIIVFILCRFMMVYDISLAAIPKTLAKNYQELPGSKEES